MVYWTIEPPAEQRLEIAIAQLTTLMANIYRDAKVHPDLFSITDFLTKWGHEQEPEPEEDGMAPDRVMAVMDGLMAQQERREQILRRKRQNGG